MADTDQVLNLAAIIRKVDGNHSKGAAVLAESILDHPRFRAVLADEPAVPAPTVMEIIELSEEAEAAGLGQVDFARAVLARWGHQPAPPADGEVAELVAWLRETGDTIQPSHLAEHQRYKRAAELLQQMEDLAADAVAGLRYIEESCGRLYGVGWDRVYGKADRLKPAHALPLPEVGE